MSENDKRGVEYEGTLPLDTVLSYHNDLSSRLASGEVQVENGAESSVLLVPSESVQLNVRAREKDGGQSLRFEMAWERSEATPMSNGLSFTSRNGAVPPSAPVENAKPRATARSRSRTAGRKRTTLR